MFSNFIDSSFLQLLAPLPHPLHRLPYPLLIPYRKFPAGVNRLAFGFDGGGNLPLDGEGRPVSLKLTTKTKKAHKGSTSKDSFITDTCAHWMINAHFLKVLT